MPHYVYIARCSDRSLYTGTCVDLKERETVHNTGKGAKYTRSRRPVKIIYHEECETLSAARKREAQIKKLSRPLKERLILGLDFTPPKTVAEYAEEGLRLRKQYKRGGTMVGVARARDLKNRKALSPRTIQRMVSFFARHEVDKRGKNFSNPKKPSNGFIAWMLWGGDPGKDWANGIYKKLKKIDS